MHCFSLGDRLELPRLGFQQNLFSLFMHFNCTYDRHVHLKKLKTSPGHSILSGKKKLDFLQWKGNKLIWMVSTEQQPGCTGTTSANSGT